MVENINLHTQHSTTQRNTTQGTVTRLDLDGFVSSELS